MPINLNKLYGEDYSKISVVPEGLPPLPLLRTTAAERNFINLSILAREHHECKEWLSAARQDLRSAYAESGNATLQRPKKVEELERRLGAYLDAARITRLAGVYKLDGFFDLLFKDLCVLKQPFFSVPQKSFLDLSAAEKGYLTLAWLQTEKHPCELALVGAEADVAAAYGYSRYTDRSLTEGAAQARLFRQKVQAKFPSERGRG